MPKEKSNTHTHRSQIARDHLQELGYREFWQAKSDGISPNVARLVTLFNNGAGKSVMLLEYADGQGWDIYGRLCNSNRNADTLAAVSKFSEPEAE